jgi:hypothetical protein
MALHFTLEEFLTADDLDEALNLAESLNRKDAVIQKQIE